MHRNWFALSLAVTIITGLSPSARAGGFTIPLIGGRGSTKLAFVARPDDTSATYHNPAGLALLGPYQFDISGLGVLTHTTFSRCTETLYDGSGTSLGCRTGGDGRPLYERSITTAKYGPYPEGFGILPFLGMSGRFGLKKWNFGLAVYSPHNATGAFPDCRRGPDGEPLDCSGAPQRFFAVLGTINTIYINPAVSYQPHPAIAIGLGVSAVRASILLERALWLGGPDSTAAALGGWEGEGSVHIAATAWSWAFNFGVIWNLGATFAPGNRWLKGLRFGASYSSQTSFTFKDTLSIYSPLVTALLRPSPGSGGCHPGDPDRFETRCQAEAKFTFPMQVRIGLDWEITPEIDVGVDFFWQNYAVYDEIRIRFPEPLTLQATGDPISVDATVEPKNSKDVMSVAVGAQYSPRWAKGLEFRLGFIWDQSAYPNRTYTLLNPDADKLGLAVGVGYRFKYGVDLSIGYVGLFYADRVVRDSAIRPSICPPGDLACRDLAPDAPFSMNGDVVRKRVDLFALQLGWRLDPRELRRKPAP
jgi:long-subunit fatty acid transport protein